jgi:AraC family transcriptional regulator
MSSPVEQSARDTDDPETQLGLSVTSHENRQSFDAKPRDLPERKTQLFEHENDLNRYLAMLKVRAPRDPRLVAVERFIIRNLTRRATLAELARVACLEKRYLATLFKRETGLTIGQWQRVCRVEHAIALLANRRLPIADIARAVGYQEMTSLERAFHTCVGATPRDIRAAFIRRS